MRFDKALLLVIACVALVAWTISPCISQEKSEPKQDKTKNTDDKKDADSTPAGGTDPDGDEPPEMDVAPTKVDAPKKPDDGDEDRDDDDDGDGAATLWTTEVALDTLWVLVAGFLVFFMNAGFGCLEAGFCRAKNAVNILGKNFVVFGISSLAFWAIGFAIMFGNGNSFFGYSGAFVAGPDNSPSKTELADLVKADVKAEFDIDLGDESAKDKYGRLVEQFETQINGASESLVEIVSSNRRQKSKDDKDPVEYTVKLEITDKGTFEKTYDGSEFYWGVYSSISWATVPLAAKFFFQLAFAATAATIVSGCVAERIHYRGYMMFVVFIVGLSYPITGHWIWGGGWLADKGFYDFAGSTVVHSVGGWAGLAGILLLGSRIGKYRDNKPQAIPGHSMAMVFLGGMILWLGWFGFNPGSTMGISGSGAMSVAHIVVTTNMACAAGLVAATIVAWTKMGKPDFSMTVNGALAGLVAITAPCAWVTPAGAVVIGLVAGALVVYAVLLFDEFQIDDPVGALSVHLVNGIWGTLAIGLFSAPVDVGFTAGDAAPLAGLFYKGGLQQFGVQLVGVLAVGALTFGGSLGVWSLIKSTGGLRVEPDDEMRGLDLSEMGMEAYPGDTVG